MREGPGQLVGQLGLHPDQHPGHRPHIPASILLAVQ
jgi:hypothetical protein